MTLRWIDTSGNSVAALGDTHPDQTKYVAQRRDMGNGGRVTIIRHLARDGSLIDNIKAYAEKPDGALSRELRCPVEDVDGPMGAASVKCLPDGSLDVFVTPGNGRALCGFAYENIPDACPRFDTVLGWTVVQSADDLVARQQAAAVASQVEQLKVVIKAVQKVADQAASDIKDLKKQSGGLKASDVAALVAQSGPVRDSIWKLVGDLIYAQLRDATSPIINVIRQGGKPIS